MYKKKTIIKKTIFKTFPFLTQTNHMMSHLIFSHKILFYLLRINFYIIISNGIIVLQCYYYNYY